MFTYLRTDSTNLDFQALVRKLDLELGIRDGEDHAFYAQFNKIDKIPYAVVAYDGEEAVACGALRPFSDEALEVKRMYVLEQRRGQGIAQGLLQELEQWARELAFQKCILETGKRQPEAIQLYLKCGYRITVNYGQYAGIENSVCFEKILD